MMAAGTSMNARKSNQNIQVYLRVRPTNERERNIRSIEMVEVPSQREVIVKQTTFESKLSKKFTFDRAFGPDSKQSEVYQAVVAPFIEEVLSGYNCTVFAYGQTGTGKTHTMVGEEIPTIISSYEDDSALGIIPRALSHLFQELRLMGVEFSMRVSYLELYNEELCDLLSPSEATPIRIFDDATKKGSIIVQGLEEIPVHSTNDVYKLLAKGQEKRRTAATLMNAQSSRSHTIFSITVHIRENGIEGEELLKIGKLNLVDLAGSENLSKAGNEKGIRTRETVNINQSLLTLGRVITALVERTPHIPYRESKLTRLLQESLGGRTKTSIIATVSPGHKDLEETLSTLEYAHRAKNIQNRPEINQKLTKKTVLKDYTEEIDRLKRDLQATREKNGIYVDAESHYEKEKRLDSQKKELEEKETAIKAMKDEMQKMKSCFAEVSDKLTRKEIDLQERDEKLVETSEQLDQTQKILRTTKWRYQEKKHLLESHVQTETLLRDQATELIDVVESASTDSHRLHDTIERQRTVFAKNRIVTETHAKGMDEQLQQFDVMLEETSKKCQNWCSTQLDEMKKAQTFSDEFSTVILAKLKQRAECDAEWAAKLMQCIRGDVEKLCTGNDAQKESLQASEQQAFDHVNGHADVAAENLQKLKTNIVEKRNSFGTHIDGLIEMNTNASSDVEAFCQKRSSAARDLLPIVLDLVGRNEKNNQTLRTQIDQNTKRMHEMQSHLQTMFDDITQTNAHCNEQVVQNSNLLEMLHKTVAEHLNETVERTNQLNATSDSKRSNQNVALQSFKNDIISASDIQTQLVQLQIDENTKLKAVLNERLTETLNMLDTQQTATRERIQELQQDVERLQAECTEVADANNAAIIASVQSDTQRLCNSHMICVSLTDALQRGLNEYGRRVTSHVTECRESIVLFHRNELQTYRSTGETPAKREYVYPRHLAQTSPDDRLVRRFRAQNSCTAWQDADCSVTICEGNESAFLDGITDEKSSTIVTMAGGGGGGGVRRVPALLLNGGETSDVVQEQQQLDTSSDLSSIVVLQEQQQQQRQNKTRMPRPLTPTMPSTSSDKMSKSPHRLSQSVDNKENVR